MSKRPNCSTTCPSGGQPLGWQSTYQDISIASMLFFTALQSRLVIHELLLTAFILLTAPVVTMLIMRTAVYRDLRARRRESETG